MKLRDRIVALKRVPANQIAANPSNYRRHPEKQTKALKAIINEIGFAGAILVRELADGRYEIIDGHARTELVGKTEIPVLVTDLTEEEAKKMLLTYDTIAGMAEVDQERMHELLSAVHFSDQSIVEVLKRLDAERAYQAVAPREPVDPPAKFDQAAELQKKWGTALGQVWQAGAQTLYCGDCREVATDWRATVVLSDPPYNVGKEYGKGTNDEKAQAEYMRWTREWFAVAKHVTETAVVLTIGITNLPMWLCDIERTHKILAWIKTNQCSPQSIGPGGGFNCWEPVLVYGRAKKCIARDIFDIPIGTQADTGDHPCPKSLKAWIWLIEAFTDSGDSVADFFNGSGTTLIAAEQLGRKGIACEIEPKYVAVCLERLKALGLAPKMIG